MKRKIMEMNQAVSEIRQFLLENTNSKDEYEAYNVHVATQGHCIVQHCDTSRFTIFVLGEGTRDKMYRNLAALIEFSQA